MFWISEELGVAAEYTEAGVTFFSKESDDFTIVATDEESDRFWDSSPRPSNADEATDFARSKLAESTASSV